MVPAALVDLVVRWGLAVLVAQADDDSPSVTRHPTDGDIRIVWSVYRGEPLFLNQLLNVLLL